MEQQLKRVQDLLVTSTTSMCCSHDQESDSLETEDSRKTWEETIERGRHERIETYRQLTLAKPVCGMNGVPASPPMAASKGRHGAAARDGPAIDPRPRRTSLISRIA